MISLGSKPVGLFVEPQPCTHLAIFPTAFSHSLLPFSIFSSINLFKLLHYMSFYHGLLTMLMFDCLIRILEHIQQFRSCSAIPQLFRDSAAFLLFDMLHVSSQGTSHMGMLGWMYTWIVCYWLSQTSHVCPWSTQVFPRSNGQVLNGGTGAVSSWDTEL